MQDPKISLSDKGKVLQLENRKPEPRENRMYGNSKTKTSKLDREVDLCANFDIRPISDKHNEQKAARANRIIGLIARKFVHIEIILYRCLFSALVGSHLKYATQIWSPHWEKFYHAGDCSFSCNKERWPQTPQLGETSAKTELANTPIEDCVAT